MSEAIQNLLQKHIFGTVIESNGVFLLRINEVENIKIFVNIWRDNWNIPIDNLSADPYLRAKISADFILVELPENPDEQTMKEILGNDYSKKSSSFLRGKILLLRGLNLSERRRKGLGENSSGTITINDLLGESDGKDDTISQEERERLEHLFGIDKKKKNILDLS